MLKRLFVLICFSSLICGSALGQATAVPAPLSDVTPNPTIPNLSNDFPMYWNGTTWDRFRGDATNGLWINLLKINGVTPSVGHGIPDTGTQRVFVGQKATYGFATTAKTATAAGTGPFFSICGSGTKTVRLQQLIIGGTVASAAVYGDVELRKTSTATSAGTATALTKVPHDSNSAASTATLLNFYTALATTGTNVGMIGSQGTVFPLTGTVAAAQAQVVFDWTNRQESEALVLRGTAQCIEASFGTTTTNAPTLTVQGIYTEE